MGEFIMTSGSVMFEDAVKKPVPDTDPQYYPTKRARAEIMFEGGEEGLDAAADLAQAKVAEMLGVTARPTTAATPPTGQDTPADEPQKRKRRTKAQIAADEAAANPPAEDPFAGAAGQKPSTAPTDTPTTGDDPFASSGAGEGSGSTGSDAPPAAEASPDTSQEDWGAEAAVEEVTDDDLTSAVTRKNAELKDAKRIRQLIGEFVDPPKGLKDIAQDDRSSFLKKLAVLKPAS